MTMSDQPIRAALQRQTEIYLNGLAGDRPKAPVNMEKLARAAQAKLTPEAFAYIAGGAGQETTIDANRAAFDRWKIVPRMLRDISQRDTRVELLGMQLPAPFLLSPIGVLEMAHPQADRAVARAAAQEGIPFIFSNQASVPMEDTAAVMGSAPRWFQLYWSKSQELVASFVQRAEACGCSAIVVTLDTTILGWRIRDLDLAYLPFLRGKGIAQYTSDPVFQKMMDEPSPAPARRSRVTLQSLAGLLQMGMAYPDGTLKSIRNGRARAAVQTFITRYSQPGLTWDDLAFLRDHTQLPILLKGILHPDDAKLAVEYGMDGIIVSNHGGRQVDGAIAAIDALPEVVAAVNGTIPVLMDSGIRSGADIFKAIAMGASAVCIARPYVYGLAVDGEQGVQAVIQNFKADFEITMALAGCRTISEVRQAMLKQVNPCR
jgi:lactate 2-monooxygenase